MLVACMFCLCTVTGTLSKYIGNFNFPTASSPRAGLFKVEVLKSSSPDVWQNIGSGSALTINLFQTLTESSVGTAGPDNTPEGADHVALAAKVIAPGTGGAFKVTVRNESEVDVRVSVSVAGGTAVGKLQWYVSAGTWSNVTPGGGMTMDLDNKFKTNTLDSITIPPLTKQGEIDFYWRWLFDSGDNGGDTTLGRAQTVYSNIPVTITATQLD